MKKRIVAIGACVADTLMTLPHFPKEDSKLRALASKTAGGGPAATGLAYDLHLNGYQAVDIGHVDVEYEWLLMGAEKKTALKNKMVFEAAKNSAVEDCFDEKYESEIIAKFI